MKIEATSYRQWPEAYRCTAGAMELLVVTSLGPRILSLRLDGGRNLLYEDNTDFRVGAWRLYGGHRFTIAPESDASYLPDNARCDARVEADRLVVCAPSPDGLQRSLEIRASPDHPGFALRHLVRNAGPWLWLGAAWAITCVPPVGKVVVPRTAAAPRFWTPPGRHYADASSRQWRNLDSHFLVEPNGERGKIGLASPDGWLAWLGPEATFVIHGPARDPQAPYPDDGCNVEVFTCAHYLELETLGPLTTLLPGEELVHEQHWRVIPAASTPAAWRALGEPIHPFIHASTHPAIH